MMKTRCVFLLVALLAGCANVIDPEGLGEIDDYKSWHSFSVNGELPAHGDTVRTIYANDVAQSWSGAGAYPIGTIIIKEIYPKDSDVIDYIAIMRKLDVAPDGGELQEGWLYTILRGTSIDVDEENNLTCYRSCHVAAPYDNLFHDFGY